MSAGTLIYVAGPYRGANGWEVEQNIREAERLGFVVANLGAVPIVPHSMYRFWDRTLTDEFWLEGTLHILRRCDAVLLARNWHVSEGTIGEKAEAERLKIPVFDTCDGYAMRNLTEWLAQRGI